MLSSEQADEGTLRRLSNSHSSENVEVNISERKEIREALHEYDQEVEREKSR